MGKIFTLLATCLLFQLQLFAQAPSIGTITNIEGDRFYIPFSASSGSRRIVVVKQDDGTPIGTPTNGTNYIAENGAFPFGTKPFANSGEFVVYSGTASNTTITGLRSDRTYRVVVFEVTNTSTYIYNASSEGSQATMSTPGTQTSGINFTILTGNSVRINYTGNSGIRVGRVIVMKAGSAVDVFPSNYREYSANLTFGSGANLGNDNFVVVRGNSEFGGMTITGLTAGTTYYVAAFEYNGDHNPAYNLTVTAGNTASITMPNKPTTSSSNLTYNSIEGNEMFLQWTNGNGAKRIVVASTSSVTFVPTDGTDYTADPNFASGTDLGEGQYVVHNGSANSFSLKSLSPNTRYYFRIYEYNGTGTATEYLRTTSLAGDRTTLGAPTTLTSAITAGSILTNEATISYATGNGAGRLFVMKAGAPVDAAPVNFTNYTSTSTSFGTVTLGGTNNALVYKPTGPTPTPFTVTNLSPNTIYHVAAFEYHGSTPVYAAPAMYSFTTPPSTASSNVLVSYPSATSIKLDWTKGNGAMRMVVMKQGTAVTGNPQNFSTYTANNVWGGAGASVLNPGEYVVYNGNDASPTVTVTGLTPGVTYYYTIFEFNDNPSPVYNAMNIFQGNAIAGGIPLPLTWVSFTGRKIDKGIELTWATVDEINTDHFVVERSSNGVHFEPIDIVPATMQSTINNYRYIDTKASGRVTYRIKQVDKDDRSEYSKVISVLASGNTADIQLYPNPAVNKVYVKINGKANVRIYDVKGSVVLTAQLLQAGYIDVQSLQPGMYTVEVIDQNQTHKAQLLKQ